MCVQAEVAGFRMIRSDFFISISRKKTKTIQNLWDGGKNRENERKHRRLQPPLRGSLICDGHVPVGPCHCHAQSCPRPSQYNYVVHLHAKEKATVMQCCAMLCHWGNMDHSQETKLQIADPEPIMKDMG